VNRRVLDRERQVLVPRWRTGDVGATGADAMVARRALPGSRIRVKPGVGLIEGKSAALGVTAFRVTAAC
jgi:hypothetical protein